jgi:hypothetical protein
MLDLIATGASYLFSGGRAMKLVKNRVNITNCTNPLMLSKSITLTVIGCCAPPIAWLPAHCIAAVAAIGASFASPNPVIIGSAVYFISEIYENC